MPHRSIRLFLAMSMTLFFAACKKKEPPAVIEEVPAAAAPVETDTSATLAEEPSLKKVGEESKTKAPPHSPAAEAAGFSDHGPFVVQVSVFKSKRQASGLVEKLANQGFPAYVAEVENPTAEMSGTWHRVRIGRFAHIADARSFGENTLRGMGYDFWVDNKKNDKVGAADGAYGGSSYSSTPSSASSTAPSQSSSFESTPPPAAPSVPSEPAPPAATGETWGAPKPDEPAAPAGESWGTPKDETPAKTATPEKPAKKGGATSGQKAPGDTGKVNLDEW